MKIAERGGAYDIATEELREKFSAEACLLVVIRGSAGTGFSASAPDSIKPQLPALFRSMAKEVEDALAMEKSVMMCPVCRTVLAFDPRYPNNTPQPGSVTVCAHCASFIRLTQLDGWRLLTEDELLEMPDEVRMDLARTRREIERRRV